VSDFEVETFMSNIHEPYLTACQLALWHGLRRGEVCHLELTDIDFSNNIIKIQKKPHLNWNPKNETSIRTIPIHLKIKNYLNKRYIQAKKSKSKFICFFEDSGKELDEDVLSSMFIKLKKKINIERKGKILSGNFSFHSLRHKFITTLINSGQPIKRLAQ
jgi:integrase